MATFLEILPLVLKFIFYLIEETKKQPLDQRKKFLAEFDIAVEKARKGDAKELSKWLGRHL